MKALLLALLLAYTAGCSILNPTIEGGRSKVKPIPAKVERHIQLERQAALYVAEETQLPMAGALSLSLGSPERRADEPPERLTDKLLAASGKHVARIDTARERQAEFVGKKIAGTGWFRMSQWSIVGTGILLGALAWLGLRLYGLVNPVVGVGAAVAGRVASTTLATGFRQIVKAGESFKRAVETRIENPNTRRAVLDLFRQSHQAAQDEPVQAIVQKIT